MTDGRITPEEFVAARRRVMLAAGCPEHHDAPKDEPTMADASRGGCIIGTAITTALVCLLALGFVLGRCTAPAPAHDDRTRLAVCEVLDQLGADDTDGHAREFCP